MKRISVVGTGYVGLVAGTCMADFGRSVMNGHLFFDLRNVYERKEVEVHGFNYHCVGRPRGTGE